ncbi:translation factor GTPase family protein [Dactylosporangium sp. NPDC049140]|uniref:translation factor GTPase family protein n=1 Tax=Dactylosporangium sp. NPDC049140 TaxID=3155647 RepID=UPI0033EE8DBA
MSILNLGIVAHVDAGKTSLTERLLFDAGVIDRLGRVDAGSTQTDSLEQERRRGITIKSAVATFGIGGLTVNLIDTPGHPDFIAEVERALRVLDGAVLVVSAVEGVQAQTRVLLRTLRRLRVPTLVFVNKTDRTGADPDRVIGQIADAIPMWRDCAEALAEHDEEALAAYVTGQQIPQKLIDKMTAEATILPAYKGSAITGEGIDELRQALATHLPRAESRELAPLRAAVFKIDRDRVAYVRVFEGVLRTRDRVGDEKVTAIDDGRRERIGPGEIGRVQGLRHVRLGDTIGTGEAAREAAAEAVFAPPTLEATIEPDDPARRRDLHRALQRLAEQDPLIDLGLDEETGELRIKLYGEIQREVIRDTLAEEYGLAVTFGETVTLHRERPAGRARAGAVRGRDGNPHQATLELLVEPGEGIQVELAVPVEHVPMYVYKTLAHFREAIERYVRDAFARGGLHGWDVGDARVTVTQCGYQSPVSTAADFRRLVPELLARALAAAGTVVCEPVHRFAVEGPADALTATLGALPRFGAVPDAPGAGPGRFTVGGTIAAARLAELERALPGLTRGEGTVESCFAGYRPV